MNCSVRPIAARFTSLLTLVIAGSLSANVAIAAGAIATPPVAPAAAATPSTPAPTAAVAPAGAVSPAAATAPETAAANPMVSAEPAVDANSLSDANHVLDTEIREMANDAKERDYVAKLKLHTLNEEVLKHVQQPGGVKLTITHRNQLGTGFMLVGMAYALDGTPLKGITDKTGALDSRGQLLICDCKVSPGEHKVAVQYDLQGANIGVFDYLDGMHLAVRRVFTFTVERGTEVHLVGLLSTSDDLTQLYQQRPTVGFQAMVMEDKSKTPEGVAVAETAAPAAPAAAPAPPPMTDVPAAALAAPAAAPSAAPAPAAPSGNGH